MRDRYRYDSKTTTWYISDTTTPFTCGTPNPTTSNTNGNFTSEEMNDHMQDVVTPMFHRRRSNGEIINSPMTRSYTLLRNHPCSFAYVFQKKQWDTSCNPDKWTTYNRTINRVDHPSSNYFSGGFDSLPILPDFDDTKADLIDQAVSKAWAAVDKTNVQGLVCLAEGEKTIASFASIAKRLIKILRKIKRLDGKGLLFELSPKQLADRYMELRYAIRPFMYDARGVAAALSNEASTTRERLTFRGSKTYRASDSYSTSYPVLYHDNAGDWTYTQSYNKKWSRECLVRAGVLTDLEELSALNIWGLTQPIESMWELVPFSFIVDWFFDVGTVLASWTPNYGFKTLASWYTVKETTYQFSERVNSDFVFPTGSSTVKGEAYQEVLTGCWIDKTSIYHSRVPNPDRPILPSFSLRLDGFKIADLLIIAKQIFGSR